VAADLTDLKEHLNITGSDNDAELTRFLDVATTIVAGLADGSSPAEERVTASRGVAVLRRRPTGAVTHSTLGGGPVTGFTVDAAAGLVVGVPYTGTLTVTYESGSVPESVLIVAELMIASRLWETQRGNSPTILQGTDDQLPFIPGLGGILDEVRSLLEAAGQPFAGMA
jgi:hypothetical protein